MLLRSEQHLAIFCTNCPYRYISFPVTKMKATRNTQQVLTRKKRESMRLPVLVIPTGKQQNSKDKRNRIDMDKKKLVCSSTSWWWYHPKEKKRNTRYSFFFYICNEEKTANKDRTQHVYISKLGNTHIYVYKHLHRYWNTR